MTVFVHSLSRNDHADFLNEKRKDPYTQEIFKPEDRVVLCCVCKSAFHEATWSALGQQHCNQRGTLSAIPTTQILTAWPRPSGERRLNRRKKFTIWPSVARTNRPVSSFLCDGFAVLGSLVTGALRASLLALVVMILNEITNIVKMETNSLLIGLLLFFFVVGLRERIRLGRDDPRNERYIVLGGICLFLFVGCLVTKCNGNLRFNPLSIASAGFVISLLIHSTDIRALRVAWLAGLLVSLGIMFLLSALLFWVGDKVGKLLFSYQVVDYTKGLLILLMVFFISPSSIAHWTEVAENRRGWWLVGGWILFLPILLTALYPFFYFL